MRISTTQLSYLMVIIAHNIYILGFIYANQKALHPVQTNLLRGLSTFFINFSLIRYFKIGMEFKLASNHRFLLIRSGTVCIHSLTLALCGFYLPQPVIHTINCTGPIFVLIQDYFINGVRINSRQVKGIFVTFLGIVLTINGESMVQYWFDDIPQLHPDSTFENYVSENAFEKVIMGAFFAFMASIWAYGTISVKRIVGLNSLHINLHFGLFTTIFNGVIYPVFVTDPKPIQVMGWGFFLCGLPMAIGNILWVYALTINKNTGLVSICISSSVVLSYIISIFRYNQAINFICFIGSCCLVIGLIFALTPEQQSYKPSKLLQDQIQLQQPPKINQIFIQNNPQTIKPIQQRL